MNKLSNVDMDAVKKLLLFPGLLGGAGALTGYLRNRNRDEEDRKGKLVSDMGYGGGLGVLAGTGVNALDSVTGGKITDIFTPPATANNPVAASGIHPFEAANPNITAAQGISKGVLGTHIPNTPLSVAGLGIGAANEALDVRKVNKALDSLKDVGTKAQDEYTSTLSDLKNKQETAMSEFERYKASDPDGKLMGYHELQKQRAIDAMQDFSKKQMADAQRKDLSTYFGNKANKINSVVGGGVMGKNPHVTRDLENTILSNKGLLTNAEGKLDPKLIEKLLTESNVYSGSEASSNAARMAKYLESTNPEAMGGFNRILRSGARHLKKPLVAGAGAFGLDKALQFLTNRFATTPSKESMKQYEQMLAQRQ